MMMKGLPPRLRSLLMARQGSVVTAGPSTRNINIRTINSAGKEGGNTPIKRTKTEDGRRLRKQETDLKKPLLDPRADTSGGSPRSA